MTKTAPERRVPPAGLGLVLAAARRRAGLSQYRLAVHCGISESHVSKLERGHRVPSQEVALSLATVLSLDAEDRAALFSAAVPDAGRSNPYRREVPLAGS